MTVSVYGRLIKQVYCPSFAHREYKERLDP